MPQNYPTPEELEKIRKEKEAAANKDNMVNTLKKAGQNVRDKISDWMQPASPSAKAQEAIDRMLEKQGKLPKKKSK